MHWDRGALSQKDMSGAPFPRPCTPWLSCSVVPPLLTLPHTTFLGFRVYKGSDQLLVVGGGRQSQGSSACGCMRHVARDSTRNTRHATHGTGQMRPATRATRDTRHTRHTRRASTNATLDVGSTMGGARGCARRVLQPSIHKYRPKLTPRHSTCDKRDTRGARDTCETCDTPHEREARLATRRTTL